MNEPISQEELEELAVIAERSDAAADAPRPAVVE